MSTVWYWDMYPLTYLWKFFAIFLIILWPLILALFSAITIMVFSETLRNHERKVLNKRWIICKRCWDKNPRDANYCMKCGKKLKEIIL
jgi:voltage-gated potassium channel